MRKSKFTESQIVATLKQVEGCRQVSKKLDGHVEWLRRAVEHIRRAKGRRRCPGARSPLRELPRGCGDSDVLGFEQHCSWESNLPSEGDWGACSHLGEEVMKAFKVG